MHIHTCIHMNVAVVWQLMRAYTLSVLQKLAGSSKLISDSEIVKWTNTTLAEAGKSSSISGFKDPAITTSMPVIDLIDAIKPGAIKYDVVSSGTSDEVRNTLNSITPVHNLYPYCPDQAPTPQFFFFFEVIRVTAHQAKFLRSESKVSPPRSRT